MPGDRTINDIIDAVEGADALDRQRLLTALLPMDVDVEEDDETLTFEQRTNRGFRTLSRLIIVQAANIDAQGKNIAELTKTVEVQGEHLTGEICAQSKNIGELTQSLESLNNNIKTELRAQSSYRGNYAQSVAEADDVHVAGLFARQHGLDPNWVKTRSLSNNELDEWKSSHEERLRALHLKRDNALVSFTRPDVIAEVRPTRAPSDSPPSYYLVIEASFTIEQKDYDRAVDNARIIQQTSSQPAYPVVSGVLVSDELDEGVRDMIYEDVDQFIASSEPDAVYWHRLDTEDLKPPERS